MKAIDRAKKHFNSQEPKKITIQEWTDDAGKPLIVYVDPLTVKDRDHLIRLQSRYGHTIECLVYVVIRFAKGADGEPLFTVEDKRDLMNKVSPDIIAGIADVIVESTSPDEIKKKLNTMGILEENF